MSALGNITKKEIKELLTPGTILPIVILALIYGAMGSGIQGIQEQSKEPPIIGVINEENSTLSMNAVNILNQSAKIIFNSSSISDKQAGLEKLKQENGVALIVIPSNFTEHILNKLRGQIEVYWIMKGAGVLDTISSDIVDHLITDINTNISSELIQENNSTNATFILSPTQKVETTYFKDREIPGLSPTVIMSMLSSQSIMTPIIMMMIIIMAGGIVITSMALEKENKTLETLLTLPVKRTSIVTGKIVAAAAIGLILAVIYMIGMNNYFQGLGASQSGINLADYGLVLSSPQEFLLVGISLFVTLIAGLALCMLLGTFAKNFKSAQTLTFPIVALAMIPMFITMFADYDTLPIALKIFTFAIPFSHPMMATRALLFGDYLMVIAGIIYVSIFAIIIIAIVVRVFKTDRIITGTTKFSLNKIFKKKKLNK
jgi:ABC-2 type transport system permease protein